MQGLRLLAADLLVFDRHRLAWRLALRTLLALLVPLIGVHLFDQPLLFYVALGGFLVSMGDGVDDGDRQQFLRLAVGMLAGGLAVISGALASASLPLALGATLVWCFFAALLGVWGNAFAAMGLPLAWAVVEVGLPLGTPDAGKAVPLGLLWMVGGALAFVLTPLVGLGGTNAPLRGQVATCARALADYLDSLRQPLDAAAIVSPETRLRAELAEARRLASTRRGQSAERELALIESLDRSFSTAALLRDSGAVDRSALHQLTASVRELATAVDKKPSSGKRSASLESLQAMARGEDAVARLARELVTAWRILDGEAPHAPAAERPSIASTGWLGPLKAALHPQSIAARHALRFALVMAAAVVVFWYMPRPFGFWVPLTVTLVLKPYAGTTASRTVQRVVGTLLGAAAGTLLMPLLTGLASQLAVASLSFFCLMLVLRFNYSLAVFFVSLGVVPFEHVLMPELGLGADVGLWRIGATATAAALALVGGHLLWPDFERRELPGLLQHCLRSTARYAAAAINGNDLADARWQAGLDTTNFHTAAQRALSEVGLSPHDRDNILIAAASLQRLMLAINQVANARPNEAAAARALLLALADGRIDATEAAQGLREQVGADAGGWRERLASSLSTVADCAGAWA